VTVSNQVVKRVASLVGESLTNERMHRNGAGRPRLDHDDERELARTIALRELDRLATEHVASGLSPMDGIEEVEIVDAVVAKVLGLGRLQPLLDDPRVGDIHVRGCTPVRLKLTDGQRVVAAPVVDSDDELVELVRLMASRLGRGERRFDAGSPELNMQLPDGSRVVATMDISARPSLVIRKHRFEISTLAELLANAMIDAVVARFLRAAVRARRNIVIAGGTGTGKTTLLRALLDEVAPDERIVTIEDAYELGIDRIADRHPDHDMLQSRPPNIEGRGEVSMLDLTRIALRMDPDRVVVGEVRGSEAFPMLLAMSQGNNGSMCTMHADSAAAALPKLAAYVAMAGTGLPVETVNQLMSSAVHLVMHVEMLERVRRVAEVREVVGTRGSMIVSTPIFRPGDDGRAVPGDAPTAAMTALLARHGCDDVPWRRR